MSHVYLMVLGIPISQLPSSLLNKPLAKNQHPESEGQHVIVGKDIRMHVWKKKFKVGFVQLKGNSTHANDEGDENQ